MKLFDDNSHIISSALQMVEREAKNMKEGRTEVCNFNTLFPKINYGFNRGEVCAFGGPQKSGKTSFMHSWFISMAQMINPPKILNIHLEMDKSQEIRRLVQIAWNKRVVNHKGLDEVKDFILRAYNGKNLSHIIRPIEHIYFYRKSHKLDDIEEVIYNVKPDIVYIDSFEQVSPTDEDGNQVRSQTHALRDIAAIADQYQLLVVTVHHLNKAANPGNINAKDFTGTMEVGYLASHVIGFETHSTNNALPQNTRSLKLIHSRRYGQLYCELIGDPETLTWKML